MHFLHFFFPSTPLGIIFTLSALFGLKGESDSDFHRGVNVDRTGGDYKQNSRKGDCS